MTNEPDEHIAKLTVALPGRVILPSHSNYAEATTLWSRSPTRPQAVVQCRNTSDVQVAIATARAAGLKLAVRGGGHDWAGRAMSDGLVIDLTRMNRVVVSPDRKSARVGGGALAIDLTRHTDPLGVCAATGSVGVVGLGGLVLGGGYGPLTGRCGLAADKLVGAEVVLADGRIVIAGEEGDRDLLWALRGGGGNFGVVTALSLRLELGASMHCGMVLYPLAEALSVVEQVDTLCRTAPDELIVQLCFISTPEGDAVVAVLPYWSGDPAEGERRVAPFLALGHPIFADVQQRFFSEALSLFDGPMTQPHHVYIDNRWVANLSPEVAEVLVRQTARRPSPGCAMATHEFRGAAARVPAHAAAFGFRRPHVLIEIVVQHDGPDFPAERIWAAETSQALASLALPGGYANLLERNDSRGLGSFGTNSARIAELKHRYDPDGVFQSAIGLPTGKVVRL
jgi:hypothetical protein